MRPYFELVDIGLQLQALEKMNKVVLDIDVIKKKGELWIEENETSTFAEIKQNITETTSDILQRCSSLTSNKFKEMYLQSSFKQVHKDDQSTKALEEISTFASKDSEYQLLAEKVKEINSNYTLQNMKIKKLQQKIKNQQRINQRLKDTIDKHFKDFEKENNSKFRETQNKFNELFLEFRKEFMTELQAASSFISQQQTQWETFCLEMKEEREIDKEHELDVRIKIHELFEKQEELSNNFENIQERQDPFGKHITF
uniref:Uncharacterized protein n=1 Tax=Biomphalaria glabrata TaxID=6526 RepID=A0A2C9L3F4_BIOGL